MQPRRIIWFAIVFSTLLYGVLAYATERNYTLQPIARTMERPVVIGLYVIAIAVYAVALLVGRRSEASSGSSQFIVSLALFEAVAILGLCAAFVIHDWRLYLPSWLLALIGFVRTYPAPAPAR